jgi:hypothetical protein
VGQTGQVSQAQNLRLKNFVALGFQPADAEHELGRIVGLLADAPLPAIMSSLFCGTVVIC